MSCSLTVCLRLLFWGSSCFSLALSVLYVLVRMYNNRILRLCQTKTAVFRQGSQKIHTFTRAIKEDTHARSPANNRSIYGTGNARATGFSPGQQQAAGAIFTAAVSERGGCADHGLSLRDVFWTPAGLYQLLFQHHRNQAGVFPDRKRRLSTARALCAHRASAGLRHRAPAHSATPNGAVALCVFCHQRHGKPTEPISR